MNTEFPWFRCKTLVPCNLFGPYDHFEASRSHLVAAALLKAHEAKLKQRNTVEVWGDGSPRRQFMYAGDLASFIFEAIPRFDGLPQTLNVATEADASVDDYYRAALRAVGWNAQLVHDATRPDGAPRRLLSVAALNEWGWTPSTTLDMGLRDTYGYFLRRHATS